jgi:hypothetical protein
MRALPFLVSSLFLFIACTSSDGPVETVLPAAPAGTKAVQAIITGKKYVAERTGLASVFANDSSISWMDELKDSSAVFKTFTEGRQRFQLHFVNDTAVSFFDDNKNYSATYKLDEKAGEDEKPGIRLRISYLDSANTFGGSGPMMMTYSYLVKGISENQLFIETPRSYNNKTVLMLLKKQ